MKLDSDGPDADADDDLPPPSLRPTPAVRLNCRKFHTDRPALFKDSAKRLRASKSKIHDNYDGEEDIAAVREKLMVDLKTAADRMKVEFWRDGVVDDDDDDDDEEDMPNREKKLPTPAPEKELKSWSLRVRRAASKAPIDTIAEGKGGGKVLKIEKRAEKRAIRNSPLRSGDGGREKSPGRRLATEKKEREKFSVALSKKEIEEDFMAMMERRPPRRPKKRPRIVQNQMDVGFFSRFFVFSLFYLLRNWIFNSFSLSIADAFPRIMVDGDHRRSLRRARNPRKRKGNSALFLFLWISNVNLIKPILSIFGPKRKIKLKLMIPMIGILCELIVQR